MMKKNYILLLFIMFSGMYAFSYGNSEEYDFSYSGITEIEINAGFLNVEVFGSRGSTVSMEALIKDSANFSVEHEKRGPLVRVYLDTSGIFSNFTLTGDQKLIFSLPRDIEYRINTASGSVYCENIDTEKGEIQTASGRVTIESSSGELDIASSSGSIRISNFEGNIAASSASGRVHLSDTMGEIRIKTASGSIRGENVNLTDDSSFQSVSGSIDVHLQNDFNDLSFNLTSVSGSLHAGGIRGKKELSINRGPLWVKGKTISGSQTYQE